MSLLGTDVLWDRKIFLALLLLTEFFGERQVLILL